jgi:hypothetical protein
MMKPALPLELEQFCCPCPGIFYAGFPGVFRFFGEYSVPLYSSVVFEHSATLRIAILAVGRLDLH